MRHWMAKLLVPALAGGLLLAGCGSDGGPGGEVQRGSTDENREMPADHDMDDNGKPLRAEALDRAFITGMVPHHQAAVDMAKVALDKGKDPQVRSLAEKVIADQEREMAEMTAIAEESYDFTPEREHEGPMGTIMGVTLSAEMGSMADQVAAAADVDRMFLMMMIPHHASALLMADEEVRAGANEELTAIAGAIVATQAEEIGQMQELLRR